MLVARIVLAQGLKMVIAPIFLFLFLMHVFALATSHICILIHLAFTLLKAVLYPLALHSSSLTPVCILPHIHYKCFHKL